MGLKKNGELLYLANTEFDAFLTADQNLEYQQDSRELDIPIVVLVARTNRLDDLRPLISDVLAALDNISPGNIIRVTI